ncbi:uncharacterized protein LOC110455624 [Mizuhopecten yessoensis]|uniref:Uncharacterized protein n=1 Tax=Mizuhopecten yessoensis TaxID=6573 RepID=A0A210QCT3_MIZYE|nr:uncharacterized protein LOC110455624 [Mizuhopecten yessoensis]OWF46529.1 hypothetical protein KP79_PYT01421 [Mizuhopecten yessoensis]
MKSPVPWSRYQGSNAHETPRYKIISMSSHGGLILFRGIPSAYIDRTGHFGIWSIERFFMNAVFLACRKGYFDRTNLDDESTSVFMVGQSLRLSTHLYRDIAHLSSSDLLVTSRAAAVGRTSMTNLYILSCADTKMELVRCTTTLVHTSIDSRRPTPLPEWFEDKYTSITDTNLDFLKNGIKTKREYQNVP